MNTFEFADRFGYKPPIKFNENQEIEFYKKGINYPLLIQEIKEKNHLYFDYKNFKSKIHGQDVISYDGITVDNGQLEDIPLYIRDKEGGNKKIKIKAKLNTREGRINIRQNKVFFGFEFNANKRKLSYKINIKYEFNNQTAIELKTFSYNDFLLLSTHLDLEQTLKLKALITTKFNQAFRQVGGNLSILKWLYEQAPPFVLRQREDIKLITDLEKLISFDKDGWLSWFKDSSSAILNLLISFNDIRFAYNHFHDNPKQVIAIYSVLDSSSQQQFCVLLDALSLPLTNNTERRSDAKFNIGIGYSLNSNLFLKNDQEKILLESKEKRFVRATNSLDILNPGMHHKSAIFELFPIEQQTMFHPLDLVTLVDNETGEKQIVTALHVKLLSDQAEWDHVIKTTILVVNIIGILVSAGVLSAGVTGIAAVIAITDIVVSSIDIVAILFESNLKQTEEGRWFLKNWDRLSTVTGVVNISMAMRKGILKHGPKLYSKLKSANALKLRIHINQLLTNIQIDLFFAYKKGIVYCSIVPIPNVSKIVGSRFATRMQQYGVLLTKQVEDSNIRALVYNGEKIAEGTEKELKVTLKKLFSSNGDEVLANLDELLRITKLKKFPRIKNKFPRDPLPKDGFILDFSMDSNGLLKNSKGNVISDDFNFIITKNGKLMLGSRHHLLGNTEDVLAAGSMKIKRGKITLIDNLSGHYKPTLEETLRFLDILKEINIPIKRANLKVFKIISNSKGYDIEKNLIKTIQIIN